MNLNNVLVAAVVGAVSMVATVNAYVYPRVEGEKLESRVSSVEMRHDAYFTEIRQKLDTLAAGIAHCSPR